MNPQFACQGWWEQDLFGRQEMHDLYLQFDEGTVSGSGNDIVGPFSIAGSIEQGEVALDKQYLDKHCVQYVGQFDGEGTMQGTWHIGGMIGRWAIRIRPPRTDHSTLQRIAPQ